ncbi:hypothetical protein J5893_04610 [bacterium]|nr:hypothetical protein [bacterium]
MLQTLPEGTLKSNLTQHAILENISNGTAKLVVTNKIAQISLQKQENKAEIEKKLSEITGETTVLEISFESKEAYFARNLGI